MKRALIVSRAWPLTALAVFVAGFAGLAALGSRTYDESPPIPARVVDPSGTPLFTRADVVSGQELFYRRGLMQYGSVFGHGGYLGPDYTAESLRLIGAHLMRENGGERAPVALAMTREELQRNAYDPREDTLEVSPAWARAFEALLAHYRTELMAPRSHEGLAPRPMHDERELHDLVSFFAWTAWVASARRPGLDYSYTNNWPPEPLAGNTLTPAAVLWSMLSLAALLGGIGVLLAAYGRYHDRLGWHGRHARRLAFRPPSSVALTPSQRACAWFFLVMAGLFLAQTMVGGASQHYRAEIADFFGYDLARILPFNLARTWHVQLALFWVSTSFLAAGIFLAPMISGHEPRAQHVLAYVLLGAVVVVALASFVGEALSVHGLVDDTWLGMQGMEYLDLGRLWQVLLTVGLVIWVVLVARALWPRLRRESRGNLPWLFLFASSAIAIFYAVGLLAHTRGHFATTDYWRFWVVHLWVEDFLELFTTLCVAYIFVLLDVVDERVALRVVYLDVILYSAGGVIGTLHHAYFSGGPSEVMAMGAFFSAAEVVPLTFLTVEAWSFLRLGRRQSKNTSAPFPHKWPILFLVSVGFWNFLGAGVFGFLINLPVVSYYEIGTALTANHGHAAMMGVYGMLALGLALFALRYLVPEDRWSDRLAGLSFASLNLGLTWMVFATLFPVGALQLWEAVGSGYVEARRVAYLGGGFASTLEWMRLPGDVVFIVGGALPILVLAYRGVRHRVARTGAPEPLFVESEGTGE